jgi:DNA repair exonuclease SbcCD ATPase subunit
MEETTPLKEAPKSNKAGIIIALLSIVVIVQSIKIYLDYKDKVEITAQKESVEEDLASTMQRLNEIKTELNEKIAQIEQLGGDITELQKAKAEVDAQLKRNTARSAKELKQLKDKVEGYEELLKVKDDEIEKLKSVNKELFTENKSLKTTQNKLGDSINQLSKKKDELAGKVAIASQLKVENLVVKGLNSKGKERDSPFKNKQFSKLKVEFNIAENKVAPIEGKKVVIRVVDENGQIIFDVAKGSGTFMLNGKEEFYTAVQEILFDNTRQKMSFLYEKDSEYASGNYTIEIYTDGYSMGTAQFAVK